jgi:hypothetical protein
VEERARLKAAYLEGLKVGGEKELVLKGDEPTPLMPNGEEW